MHAAQHRFFDIVVQSISESRTDLHDSALIVLGLPLLPAIIGLGALWIWILQGGFSRYSLSAEARKALGQGGHPVLHIATFGQFPFTGGYGQFRLGGFGGRCPSRVDRYFQLPTPSCWAIHLRLSVVSRRNRRATGILLPALAGSI